MKELPSELKRTIYLLGIKEYGSLLNPKPFTVRFRVICMAQVFWFAVNSGLMNDSCFKAISGVREPLVNMLDEIIQVTLLCKTLKTALK